MIQKSAVDGSQGTGVWVAVTVGGMVRVAGGAVVVNVGSEVAGGSLGVGSIAVGSTTWAGAQETRRRHVIASGVKTPRSNLLVNMSNPTALLHHGFDFQLEFIGFDFQLGEFGEHPLPH